MCALSLGQFRHALQVHDCCSVIALQLGVAYECAHQSCRVHSASALRTCSICQMNLFIEVFHRHLAHWQSVQTSSIVDPRKDPVPCNVE
jgi:hypothetical protein